VLNLILELSEDAFPEPQQPFKTDGDKSRLVLDASETSRIPRQRLSPFCGKRQALSRELMISVVVWLWVHRGSLNDARLAISFVLRLQPDTGSSKLHSLNLTIPKSSSRQAKPPVPFTITSSTPRFAPM
jgi:hypothetical protein